MEKPLLVAIDGPVGSGKGTLAIALSKKLNALYFYTGGMYRALTLACLRENVNLYDESKVLEILRNANLRVEVSIGDTKVYLGEELVNDQIFQPQVSNATPIIAVHKVIREEMVKRQKEIMAGKRIVVEGRDITTAVAPDADLKIYVTADVEVRAKRRYEQFKRAGIEKPLKDVLAETKLRDKQDMGRGTSPLTKARNTYIVDSTGYSPEDTFNEGMKIINELKIV